MTTSDAAIEWLQKQTKAKEIALHRATSKPNHDDKEIDDILYALDILEYLMEQAVAHHKAGKWYKQQLPTPDDPKKQNMEHYRLVCPFCGRQNGKKRERFCANCGAMLT